MLDTEGLSHWNGDLDNPNITEDDCTTDNESYIEQRNGIEDPGCPAQWDVSVAPTFRGLIRPIRKSTREAQNLFATVHALETRQNKGVKKKYERMGQLRYVARPSVSVRDILLAIGEQ